MPRGTPIKAIGIALLVLFCQTLSLSGGKAEWLQREAKAAAENPPGGTPQASTRPAVTPGGWPPVPLIYVANGDSFGPFLQRRLSKNQIKATLREGERCKPKDRDIWLVAVTDFEDKMVEVYYTPDRTTPRLREGRLMEMSVADVHDYDHEDKPPAPMTDEEKAKALTPYRQVSHPDRPFGKELETPAPNYFPFPAPRARADQPAMTDNELVNLIDFARMKFPLYATDDPFCAIRMGGLAEESKAAKDLFIVCLGSRDEGGGYMVVRRTGADLKVAEQGGWVDSLLGD
jgi:hypothetical protein